MHLQEMKSFFMWCTFLNGGILFFWTALCIFAPHLVYRTQNFWFPMSKDSFSKMMYGFIGVFKIFFIVFNLTPYIALIIMENR
ncbi:MAG: hypothetical protein CL678_12220 [Bdellovibrionaceae bacterium]|nr:hypothetical protein [Pseudobdellovibrionaceae bacterium]